jgi:hypothetical protein
MVDTRYEKPGHDDSRRDDPRDRFAPQAPLGISVGIGATAVVVAAFADAVVPRHPVSLRWLPLAVVVACFAIWAADALAAAIVAGLAFVLANGFLVNQQGELSWHGRDDLRHLGVLSLAALLGVAVGRVRAHRAAQRRYVDLEAWANRAGLSRRSGSATTATGRSRPQRALPSRRSRPTP